MNDTRLAPTPLAKPWLEQGFPPRDHLGTRRTRCTLPISRLSDIARATVGGGQRRVLGVDEPSRTLSMRRVRPIRTASDAIASEWTSAISSSVSGSATET